MESLLWVLKSAALSVNCEKDGPLGDAAPLSNGAFDWKARPASLVAIGMRKRRSFDPSSPMELKKTSWLGVSLGTKEGAGMKIEPAVAAIRSASWENSCSI